MKSEKHTHCCPCGAEFVCWCLDKTSNGIGAIKYGWRYECLECDSREYPTDRQLEGDYIRRFRELEKLYGV